MVDVVELKKQRVRLEEEVTSIGDRIRDIEWRIEGEETPERALFDQRQRAIDKRRATQKELLAIREQLIEVGVD